VLGVRVFNLLSIVRYRKLEKNIEKFGVGTFLYVYVLKEVYVYQGCIYLIINTVKAVIL